MKKKKAKKRTRKAETMKKIKKFQLSPDKLKLKKISNIC